MFITERKLPEELLYYRALNYRASLDKDSYDRKNSLERGFTGEQKYDEILDQTGHQNMYIFRNIYLNIGGSITQYDALLITESGIAVNEIKNFTGEYRVEGSSWYTGNYILPDDAPSQLRRGAGKLMRLRQKLGYDFAVTGKLIFPDENFHLYSREENLWNQVVLRSEMGDYFRSFENEYSGEFASKQADLVEQHIVANPYFKLGVEFGSIRNGLYCGGCGSFYLKKQYFHFACQSCGSRESTETHLVRAMSDFKYLFGSARMTTKRIMEFIGEMVDYRTVFRALNKYCYAEGRRKSTHYKFKYYDFDEAMRKEIPGRKYKDYLK